MNGMENLFKIREGWCIENCIQELERYKTAGRVQPHMIEETYNALEALYKVFVTELKYPVDEQEKIRSICAYKKIVLGEFGFGSNIFDGSARQFYNNLKTFQKNFPIFQRIKRKERVDPAEADQLIKYLNELVERTIPADQF